MYRPNRSIYWITTSICGISVLAWFANSYTPDSWQMIVIFFVLIMAILMSLLLYFVNNVRHVLLITGGLLILLVLRYLGLREIIYPLLLAASLLSIELMLRKR
ncbi:hypothetical protein HY949_04545 [Candidatus Gottesmanbacteria bacterium]|nr:hypothetical protein [Candidatus Gottesmanbacteria bacterium]